MKGPRVKEWQTQCTENQQMELERKVGPGANLDVYFKDENLFEEQ